MAIFKNFLTLCGCTFDWKVADYVQVPWKTSCANSAPGRKVFLLVSGGVDSTVAFALLNRALGPERVLGLHIDNGLMRKNESADVIEFMNREGFHNLKVRDATEDFLKALDGVYGPGAEAQGHRRHLPHRQGRRPGPPGPGSRGVAAGAGHHLSGHHRERRRPRIPPSSRPTTTAWAPSWSCWKRAWWWNRWPTSTRTRCASWACCWASRRN